MEYLLLVPLERPANQNHLAAYIGANQKATLPPTVAETLLAHREALGPRQRLGHLIAGSRLQE
jgi:hypothetical protein